MRLVNQHQAIMGFLKGEFTESGKISRNLIVSRTTDTETGKHTIFLWYVTYGNEWEIARREEGSPLRSVRMPVGSASCVPNSAVNALQEAWRCRWSHEVRKAWGEVA